MRLKKKYQKLSWRRIWRFITLGVSSGITQSVACIMQVVMNNSLVYYGNQSPIGGDVALSAMGIVMKVSMIMAAFGVGVEGLVPSQYWGLTVGHSNTEGLKRPI